MQIHFAWYLHFKPTLFIASGFQQSTCLSIEISDAFQLIICQDILFRGVLLWVFSPCCLCMKKISKFTKHKVTPKSFSMFISKHCFRTPSNISTVVLSFYVKSVCFSHNLVCSLTSDAKEPAFCALRKLHIRSLNWQRMQGINLMMTKNCNMHIW